MKPNLLIYLAGPDIFLPGAVELGARNKALCAAYGFTGLYPLDNPLPSTLSGPALADAIYASNLRLMDSADAIVANLTPFRGPSADAGTVFELGWMIGRGKPAFGYSAATAPFRDRTVATLPGATQDPATGRWHEADGTEIEDFGLQDNLMIDSALRLGGHPLVLHDGIEACLTAARAHFG